MRSAMGHGLEATTVGLRLGRHRGLQAVSVLDCLRAKPSFVPTYGQTKTHRLFKARDRVDPAGERPHPTQRSDERFVAP